MKAVLLISYSILFYVSILYAQSYEYMYKKQPVKDSITNSKIYNPNQTILTDNIDTTEVIGFAIAPLYKKQPESPLGNLMADCMKLYAEKIYNKSVDAAFVNFSGMRSYIPRGEITIGNLYKVSPYDNKIVLLTIQGNIFKQFLDHQASLGGWPCAGISMTIKDKHAEDVIINNQPLDETKNYTIAVADYIANGGNQCTVLKGLSQLTKNYSFRTALIEYIGAFTKAGKPVTATIESRIVYRN